MLGFRDYGKKNYKTQENFLGFVTTKKDPLEREKFLYRFVDHAFAAAGQTSSLTGPDLSQCIRAYTPAINGAIAPISGSCSTIYGYTYARGYVDNELVYPGTLYSGFGEGEFRFIFNKDTTINKFYFMNKAFNLSDSTGTANYFTIKDRTTGQTMASSVAGYDESTGRQFIWQEVQYPNTTLIANKEYSIFFNRPIYFTIPGTGYTTSIIENSTRLIDGTSINCTFNSFAGNYNVIGWGFGLINNVNKSNWINDRDFFDVGSIPGYQLWTVPKTGVYRITAVGAQGSRVTNISYAGGLGASLTADFALGIGTKVWIVSGMKGEPYPANGVGGGGSFVVLADPLNPYDHTSLNTVPLLIAAGGNGAYSSGGPGQGGSALTGTVDIGFSSSLVTNWNYVAGGNQFRGGITSYSSGIPVGGLGYGTVFGGGNNNQLNGSGTSGYGPGGGYTPDISNNTIRNSTLSYTSPLARNANGTSAVKEGHGYVRITYLY